MGVRACGRAGVLELVCQNTRHWRCDSTDATQMMAGSSVPHLAEKVAGHLEVPLMKVKCGRFSDGEVELQASRVPKSSACVCTCVSL